MMMMMMMIGIFTCVHPSRLPLTTNYLSEMFTLVTNGPSPFGKIVVPQTHTKMPGQRSFAVYCPVLWNRLLTSVRNLTVPEPFPSRTEDTVFSTELISVIRLLMTVVVNSIPLSRDTSPSANVLSESLRLACGTVCHLTSSRLHR